MEATGSRPTDAVQTIEAITLAPEEAALLTVPAGSAALSVRRVGYAQGRPGRVRDRSLPRRSDDVPRPAGAARAAPLRPDPARAHLVLIDPGLAIVRRLRPAGPAVAGRPRHTAVAGSSRRAHPAPVACLSARPSVVRPRGLPATAPAFLTATGALRQDAACLYKLAAIAARGDPPCTRVGPRCGD